MDKRSQRTKRALTKGLFTLLEETEFRRIAVNDICAAANVSRPTFYTYFEDKYSLLNYCFSTVLNELIKQPALSGGSSQDMIAQIMDKLMQYHKPIVNCLSPGICKPNDQGIALPIPTDEILPEEIMKLFHLGGPLVVFCWWAMYGGTIPRDSLIRQLAEMVDNADFA